MNTKSKIAFGIAVVLGGTAFSFFSSSSLPQAEAPQAPGTLILRKQLVFAGYKTPEATLESVYWAIVNGNYDAVIASAPKEQAAKIYGMNPKQFKSEWQNSEYKDFASLQIIARKNVSADKVELEFHELLKDQTDDQSEPGIAPMIKVGNEWKFNFNTARDYTTNWENADTIVFVRRTNSTPEFTSKYIFGAGISIPKNHLADVGYATPEDAFETYNWAWSHTNYARMQKLGFSNERFHIVAKKIIADNKVELMVQTEQKQNDFTVAFVSIQQMVKAGDQWQTGSFKNYDSTWEDGSEPEPMVQR